MEPLQHENGPAQSPVRSSHDRTAAEQNRDLREVLALLNERTRYRFTGVYRMAPPILENVGLFDRENPSLNMSSDIHMLKDTFCGVVLATGQPLLMRDSQRDARAVGNPACGRVVSYCGIPLHVDGEIRGVLCHYDPRPRLAPAGELEFLAAMETEIATYLAR